MELNTQLPTCGKWRVERHENLDSPGYVWCAFHNENDIEETHRHFPTWGEALAYADQRARTVTVTLPHTVGEGGLIHGAPHIRIGVAYAGGEKTIWITDRGLNGIEVQVADLKPLALTLLAAHHHEERGEQ